ncbi:hypothetical protein Hanom_Chr12g01132991 [Helianthus anomalus]
MVEIVFFSQNQIKSQQNEETKNCNLWYQKPFRSAHRLLGGVRLRENALLPFRRSGNLQTRFRPDFGQILMRP